VPFICKKGGNAIENKKKVLRKTQKKLCMVGWEVFKKI